VRNSTRGFEGWGNGNVKIVGLKNRATLGWDGGVGVSQGIVENGFLKYCFIRVDLAG